MRWGLVVGEFGGGGGGVAGGLELQQIDGGGGGFAADLFGLVLVPDVAGAGLHEDGVGVFAVAEDGDEGEERGEDGNAQGDVGERSLARFLHVFGEFMNFVGSMWGL